MQWVLLLHHVPPSPAYLRAKILRRLKQIGALALRNSAYLLPDSDESAEDFQWLLKEIRTEGGEAWLLRAAMVAGLTDEALCDQFRQLRSADYRELLEETSLSKLRKRYAEVSRIDFFGAPGRQEVINLMQNLEHGQKKVDGGAPAAGFRARRWVTRQGIKIDRTACCWLITRCIDPAAEFIFVDPNVYVHREGELRFDMFEGEFTHEGEHCSFEVFMERCNLRSPALNAMAEIIHDLDLKDSKYGRVEAAGVAAMIEGLGMRHSDDKQRMTEGLILFDALYARLGGVHKG